MLCAQDAGRRNIKGRVAQAEAERIEHLFRRKGLKMAVADEDALGIVVELLAAEIGAAGIVLIMARDRIGKPAGGAHRAIEHIGDAVAALHAAEPREKDGGELLAIVLRPPEIEHAARVQDHDGVVKRLRDGVEHGALGVREIVAAGRKGVFPVLARGASDDDQRRVRTAARSMHHGGRERHFRVAHRPVAPPAVIRLVLLGAAPGAIRRGKCFIIGGACVFKAVDKVYIIWSVHVSPAAVADVEPVELATSEHGDRLRFIQRERAVVFQQDAALRRTLPDQVPAAGRTVESAVRARLILHEAAARDAVNHALGELADGFRNFHDLASSCRSFSSSILTDRAYD